MTGQPAPGPRPGRGDRSLTDRRLQDPRAVPIQFIKGVGPRRATLFARLGVESVADALAFFPRRYEDRRAIGKIGQVSVGRVETVMGEVASHGPRFTPGRRGRLYEVQLRDDSGSLTAFWFHFREPYMKRRFSSGGRFIFHGEVKWDGLRLVMYHPEVEAVEEEGKESLHFGRIVPIYPLTEGLSQRQVRQILHEVVTAWATAVEDSLPPALSLKYHLPGLAESLANIHFPPEGADVAALNEQRSPWHKRLIFEEFFFLELWLLASRAEREKAGRGFALADRRDLLRRFLANLPFRLTGGQDRAFEDIRRDMLSPHPMYRLLQGDVGCGKTVVTAMAVLLAADNGLQSAIMAPTEILARQHQQTLRSLFEGLPVRVELLVSGLPAPKKKAVLERLADGRTAVAIGTHALIQEGVRFARLGLAVIDEQHRFGVDHRLTLREKGDNPDTLVATATPIPRTLAMTLYGDMDVSVIDELPPGRQPVETLLLEERERDGLYRLMSRELEAGHRAFVIYPLVEVSEHLDLKAAKAMATVLARDVFSGYGVGLVHGRLRAGDKEKIMGDFRAGKIQVLVATTVIEVGVDVPEATVMVVEHAERFGLAQLHQLRGRVGRGGQKASCFLIVSEGADEDARRRLGIMTRTNDGFTLAEEDLNERGPGEFTGLRQTGAPDFLLANVIRHRKALEYARREAKAVVVAAAGTIELTNLLELAKIRWSQRARYLAGG